MRILLSALLCCTLLIRGADAQDCAPRFEIRAWPGGAVPLRALTLSDFSDGMVLLTELDVAGAEKIQDWSDRPALALEFSDRGQQVFANHTARHIGEPVALVYEGVLLNAPTIMAEISGGQAVISGQFTPEETAKMARQMTMKTCPPEAGS